MSMESIADLLSRYDKFPYILDIPRQIAGGSLITDKLVILAFDALGTDKLNLPFLQRQVYRTVFPSSTPVFFYSFHSLLEPGEHGIMEMLTWIPKFKSIFALPQWEPVTNLKIKGRVSEKDVFPWDPLFTKLKKKGYTSTYLIEWPDGDFPKAVGKDAERIRHVYLADLARVPEVETDVVYVYNHLMDDIKHKFLGLDPVRLGDTLVEQAVKFIWKKLEPGTRLIVLSDHGQTNVRDYIEIPGIGEIPPTGGGSVAFLKDPDDKEMDRWCSKNKDKFSVHPIDELRDVYGRLSSRVLDMYGDTVILGNPGVKFAFPYKPGKRKMGVHGGVTPEEMLVSVWTGVKR